MEAEYKLSTLVIDSAEYQRRYLSSSADTAILVVFPVLVGACQVAQLIAVVAQGAPKNNPPPSNTPVWPC